MRHYELLKQKVAGMESSPEKRIEKHRLEEAHNHILRIKVQKWVKKTPQRDESLAISYLPAYRGSTTGRLYEIGGGMQGIARSFKRVAYRGFETLHNLDLRSCHVTAIAQMGHDHGHPFPVLEEYIQNSNAKHEWAALADLDVDLWKTCLMALLYGASLDLDTHGSIYDHIADWYLDNRTVFTQDEIDGAYKRLTNIAKPFKETRQAWFTLLKKTIIPANLTDGWLTNACEKQIFVGDTPLKEHDLRSISAFLCQGLESAFICHLTMLSKKYHFEVRSLEHDGMVITNKYADTIGVIPERAIQEARKFSGFHWAEMEEKPF